MSHSNNSTGASFRNNSSSNKNSTNKNKAKAQTQTKSIISTRSQSKDTNINVSSSSSSVTPYTGSLATTTTSTPNISTVTMLPSFTSVGKIGGNTTVTSVCLAPISSYNTSSPISLTSSFSSSGMLASSSNLRSDADSFSPSVLLHELNCKLERMYTSFQKQISDINLIISKIIDKKDSNDTELIAECRAKKLEQKIDEIERKLIHKDMIIDGIPFTEKTENLQSLFSKLCTTLGCSNVPIKSISRLTNRNGSKFCKTNKNSNNVSTDNGSILIKFKDYSSKINFKNLIRTFIKKSKRSLNLSDAGLQSTANIYIHDKLTKHNYQIFRHALKLKKSNKISYVYTYDGKVFVVQNAATQPTWIQCLDDFAAE